MDYQYRRSTLKKKSKLSVRRQCQLLQINRSGLYLEPKRPDESARLKRENIMARIDSLHNEMPAIGYRKITVLLIKEGYEVGRKYVRNCMTQMGIHAIYPKVNLSKRNFKQGIMPYLLRNYNACFPNQVWSIDITFIKMYHMHMYLTAVIDWYSRKIVGWNLADTLDTQEVIKAVKAAIAANGTPSIINSDQGSQFTSEEYKTLLKELHIRQSMDGKSRWADNIMVERWFRSLKTELIYPNEYHCPKELRRDITDYIENYNTKRPHEALNYDTPESVYSSCFTVA